MLKIKLAIPCKINYENEWSTTIRKEIEVAALPPVGSGIVLHMSKEAQKFMVPIVVVKSYMFDGSEICAACPLVRIKMDFSSTLIEQFRDVMAKDGFYL